MPGTATKNIATGCLVLLLPIAFLLSFVFVAWPVLVALLLLLISLRLWQESQWQKLSQTVNPIFHELIQVNQGAVTALDLAMKANISASAAQRYLDAKVEEFAARTVDYEDQGTMYYFITASTLGSIFDKSEPPSLYERQPLTPSTPTKIPDESTTPSLEDSNPITPSTPAKTYDDSQPFSRHESEPIKSSTLGKIFDESEPPSLEETASPDDAAKLPEPLAEEEPAAPPAEKQVAAQSLIQSELAKRLEVHSSTIFKRRADPDFPEWSRSRDPEGIAWEYLPDTKEFYPLETEP
jgi:hypothetical protein